MTDKIEASIEPAAVSLLAGETAELTAKVTNLGQTMDQFTLNVDGLDSDWYTMPVSSVALFPNDQDSMRIILHPPKALEGEPGRHTFRISVASQENPEQVATSEVTIEIKSRLEVELHVSPEQAAGRTATYQVRLKNPRDSQITVRLEATDDRRRMRYHFGDSTLTAPGEGETETALEVRPGWLAFFGGERPFDFRVGAALPDPESHTPPRFCNYCGHEFLPTYDGLPVLGPWYSNRLRRRHGGAPVFCPSCSRRIRADARVADAQFIRTSWTQSLRRPRFRWMRRLGLRRLRLPSRARQPVIDDLKVATTDERDFMIAWTVRRAREVKLGDEEVDAQGELFVRPTESTTYVLTAINRKKTVSRTVEVLPLPLPKETAAERIGATLSPTEISVQAGSVPAQMMLQVQNLGDIVDKFTVEIEGIDQDWCSRSASSVALMPQGTDQVRLSFQPPKKEGVRAGEYPFVIVVRSQAAPEHATIVAGRLEIVPAPEYTVQVRPVRVTCRRKGTFRVDIASTGVGDAAFSLKSTDLDEGCRFQFKGIKPKMDLRAWNTTKEGKMARIKRLLRLREEKRKRPELKLRAWSTAEVRMVARPKRRFLVGEEKRFDITVAAVGKEVSTQPANCELHHRPFFRSVKNIWRLIKAIIVLVILIVLIYLLIQWGGGWSQLTSDPGEWFQQLLDTFKGWFS